MENKHFFMEDPARQFKKCRVFYSNKMCNLISMKPGVHWMQPFVTEVVSIRITPETMTMAPMICTTQDGVRNVFRDVQV